MKVANELTIDGITYYAEECMNKAAPCVGCAFLSVTSRGTLACKQVEVKCYDDVRSVIYVEKEDASV